MDDRPKNIKHNRSSDDDLAEFDVNFIEVLQCEDGNDREIAQYVEEVIFGEHAQELTRNQH